MDGELCNKNSAGQSSKSNTLCTREHAQAHPASAEATFYLSRHRHTALSTQTVIAFTMAMAPFFGFDPFFGGLDTAIDRAFDRSFNPPRRGRRGRGEGGEGGQQDQGTDVGSLALTFPGLASTLTTAGAYPMVRVQGFEA